MDSERSQKFEKRELSLLKCVIAMRIGREYHPVTYGTMNARLSANSVNKKWIIQRHVRAH